VLIIMRMVAVMILAFAFLSWDIGENHGRCTHALHSSINDLVRVAHLP
jgi:hypothetical protein